MGTQIEKPVISLRDVTSSFCMSTLYLAPVRQDSSRSCPGPLAGGAAPRLLFTPAQKLDHLDAYEAACERDQGGTYLREQGP